jgi:C1A family cysteine protease
VGLEYESSEIFRGWASAESGAIVAAAARMGTSTVYGVREARDGRLPPAFALFDLYREGFPDIGVCTIAAELGGQMTLSNVSAAAEAAEFFIVQANDICDLQPRISAGKVLKAQVRVVAGRMWTLTLRANTEVISGVEVWQDTNNAMHLTDSSRALADGACSALRQSRRALSSRMTRIHDVEDEQQGSSAEPDPPDVPHATQFSFSSRFHELLPRNLSHSKLHHSAEALGMGFRTVSKFGELPVDDSWVPPASFDLRSSFPACVNPSRVRYQGQCGSCWSFATQTAWANQICIRDGASDSNIDASWTLSTQYQLTCNKEQSACQGGMLASAWKWNMQKGGLTETALPYGQSQNTDNVDSTSCSTKTPTERVKCRSRRRLRTDRQIMYALSKYNTPVTVGMMTYKSFYKDNWWGTVYQPTKAEVESGGSGGHAVQIVGWGTDTSDSSSAGRADPDYWIIENSWGPSWVSSRRTFCYQAWYDGLFVGGLSVLRICRGRRQATKHVVVTAKTADTFVTFEVIWSPTRKLARASRGRRTLVAA